MLHLIKDLRWRIKFFDGEETGDYLCRNSVELEADVGGEEAEELSNALKALMKVRGLRKGEVERLKALPLKEACRELAVMLLLEV
jgi:hypothetical protein